MSFVLTHRLLLYDLPFLSYIQSVNNCSPYSQPHLAKSCTNVIFYFMVRCGQFVWYINPVCLRIMIHIAEAVIGVLDLTGWARQKAGPISTLDCSYGFRVSLFQSIIRCSLIGGLITSYVNRASTRPQVITNFNLRVTLVDVY